MTIGFRVLRAVSRFDAATSDDVRAAFGDNSANVYQAIRRQLLTLARRGLLTRDGRLWRITDAGRRVLRGPVDVVVSDFPDVAADAAINAALDAEERRN